jgi:hypothetical protein
MELGGESKKIIEAKVKQLSKERRKKVAVFSALSKKK